MGKEKAYSGRDGPLVKILKAKFREGKTCLKYKEIRNGSEGKKGPLKRIKQDTSLIVKEKKLLLQLRGLNKGASFKKLQMIRSLKVALAAVRDAWKPSLEAHHTEEWLETMQKRLQLLCRDWSQAQRKDPQPSWFRKDFPECSPHACREDEDEEHNEDEEDEQDEEHNEDVEEEEHTEDKEEEQGEHDACDDVADGNDEDDEDDEDKEEEEEEEPDACSDDVADDSNASRGKPPLEKLLAKRPAQAPQYVVGYCWKERRAYRVKENKKRNGCPLMCRTLPTRILAWFPPRFQMATLEHSASQ